MLESSFGILAPTHPITCCADAESHRRDPRNAKHVRARAVRPPAGGGARAAAVRHGDARHAAGPTAPRRARAAAGRRRRHPGRSAYGGFDQALVQGVPVAGRHTSKSLADPAAAGALAAYGDESVSADGRLVHADRGGGGPVSFLAAWSRLDGLCGCGAISTSPVAVWPSSYRVKGPLPQLPNPGDWTTMAQTRKPKKKPTQSRQRRAAGQLVAVSKQTSAPPAPANRHADAAPGGGRPPTAGRPAVPSFSLERGRRPRRFLTSSVWVGIGGISAVIATVVAYLTLAATTQSWPYNRNGWKAEYDRVQQLSLNMDVAAVDVLLGSPIRKDPISEGREQRYYSRSGYWVRTISKGSQLEQWLITSCRRDFLPSLQYNDWRVTLNRTRAADAASLGELSVIYNLPADNGPSYTERAKWAHAYGAGEVGWGWDSSCASNDAPPLPEIGSNASSDYAGYGFTCTEGACSSSTVTYGAIRPSVVQSWRTALIVNTWEECNEQCMEFPGTVSTYHLPLGK